MFRIDGEREQQEEVERVYVGTVPNETRANRQAGR